MEDIKQYIKNGYKKYIEEENQENKIGNDDILNINDEIKKKESKESSLSLKDLIVKDNYLSEKQYLKTDFNFYKNNNNNRIYNNRINNNIINNNSININNSINNNSINNNSFNNNSNEKANRKELNKESIIRNQKMSHLQKVPSSRYINSIGNYRQIFLNKNDN